MFKVLFGVVFVVACFFNVVAASAIDVYPLEANLGVNNRFQDIKVYNVGSDTAYVQAQIIRVENPGLPNQTLVPLEDNPFQVGLIVTPNKMVIPANQMRLARVLYIGDSPKDNDVVYKVTLSPVSGQLIPLGSLQNVNAGVELIISYGINVFIRPLVPQPQILMIRAGQDLLVKNMGNTNVLLGSCQQCDVATKQCQDISLTKRVYVGMSFHYHLPQSVLVSCKQVFTDQLVKDVRSN